MGNGGVFNRRIRNVRKDRDKAIRNARKRAGVQERAKRERMLVSGARTGKSKRRQLRKEQKKLRSDLVKGILDTDMGDEPVSELPNNEGVQETPMK